MNIEELSNKENSYIAAKGDFGNAGIQLSNALTYLNASKNELEKNYKINGNLIDDGNIKNIIDRVYNARSFIENKLSQNFENEKNNIHNEIESML